VTRLKSLAHPEWPYDGTPNAWRGFGPVVLPAAVYEAAEKQGIDLRGYIKQECIPTVYPTYQKQKFGPELP